MPKSELLKRIFDLEAQVHNLLTENERLRGLLGMQQEVVSVETASQSDKIEKENSIVIHSTLISKYSSPEEKIELFMSLFRGRDDVYAKRCFSKKYESAYYVPACKNEWIKGVCDKGRIKCKDCRNRDLLSLTKKTIDTHLRNQDENGVGIIGIYPLLSDETCWFLAIDFDEEQWRDDVAVFRSVCDQLSLPIAVERSRSGNGAHVWIFFDDPVLAIFARKLGNALLTKAMSVRHEIRFTSYDRMFPNQDFMPKGGFGNLIALPLQGGARKKGNSEFVDEHFESYPDQWAYLSSVKKATLSEIQNLLDILCAGNGLGELGNAAIDGQETLEPWATKKPDVKLERNDFTGHLTIIEANRLYIPKEGVSQRALNRIKRLAAFQNPLFYKTQKMRMSTYGIPRIISSMDETDEYIGIPRGCRQALINLLRSSDVKHSVKDKRNSGRQIKVDFAGTLREEQQLAANTLLDYENGILSLPTAFGKTVIGASLIASRKCNTLILVHMQTLLDQWQKSLGQFLEINESLPEPEKKRGRKKIRLLIGQIGSGKNTSSGIIDIALIQSLIHENEVEDIVKNYGMVIVDECHHASSLNFERVLGTVNARYVYGLTATPNRHDGQHPIAFMQCGPIRYRISAKEQADKRSFEHFVVPCFTKFRKPHTQNEEDWHITKVYTALSEDEERNEQIVTDVLQAVNDHRTPIILTQRKEHVVRLAVMLENRSDARVITLVGANSTKDKKKMAESLGVILPDEKLIIVATGKYIGEGFDYPRLDTLFLVSPIAWKGTLSQYAGRLHREYPGKRDVIVYDYVDIHIPVLERMYHKRLKGYAAIGYKALAGNNLPDKASMIYDIDNYVPAIVNDLAQTEKEIVISSPYIQKRQADTVLEWLGNPLSKGIDITIITRPAESYKDSERAKHNINLLRTKTTVILKSDILQHFAIIDNQLVWYGSSSLLCRGSRDDSIIRLYSKELAAELKEIAGYSTE